MKIKPFGFVFTSLFIGLFAISFSTYSVAAPFSITYTGTVGTESSPPLFPEVNEGESYSLTLVFDNGSATLLSQTWEEADLICATFIVNDAQDVQFSNDLTVTPEANSHSGNISTDGAGILTSNFVEIYYRNLTSAQYEAVGIQLTDPVSWFANDNNNVFFDENDTAFGDAAGGVLMDPANWSDPVPYGGTCGVTAPPPMEPPPPATPIPTTSQSALIILSVLFGLMVFANRRRLF